MKFSQTEQHCRMTVKFALIIASLMLFSPAQRQVLAQQVQVDESKSATTQDLPSGEEVMAKHIAHTGGQAAYDKIKNRVAESTLEIVGQGVSLNLITYAAKPNKVLIKIESELTGKIEKGCDGKVVWENTLVGGPVIHDGAQRASGLRDSTFERFVYWKSIFESAECKSITKVGDADCYEVVLTTKKSEDGDPSSMRLFVDVTDYLIRKIETVVESEVGKIEVIAHLEDYRKVDDLLISHKMNMNILGQNREVTITSLKHNVDLPENQFDLPAEVQALLQ